MTRKFTALLAALMAALSTFAAAEPSEGGDVDWILIEVEFRGDPETDEVHYLYEVFVEWAAVDDQNPRYHGYMYDLGEGYAAESHATIAGSPTLSMTSPAGGQSFPLPIEDGETRSARFGFSEPAEGELVRHRILVMGSGIQAVAYDLRLTEVYAGEFVSERVVTGSGTQALLINQDDSGASVSAGATAAGMTSQQRPIDVGIVGFISPINCGTCRASWESPDGRRGEAVQVGTPAALTGQGFYAFAGPSGNWTFAWDGLVLPLIAELIDPASASQPSHVLNDKAFGMFAPIGDLWASFELGQDTSEA